MSIWQPALPEQLEWVEKFKNIMIHQRKDELDRIFCDNFEYQNGFTKSQYAEYEFAEFALKCQKFGLESDCLIQCFNMEDNLFYFSLGKKEDKALFESIFYWSHSERKAKGNGYRFKIEPKIQFIRSTQGEKRLRRVNFTPFDNNRIKTILVGKEIETFHMVKQELPAYLGGHFYSAIYELSHEQDASFWDTLTIYSSQGVHRSKILMRGKDHPCFIDNLYPKLSTYEVSIRAEAFPVVVYVLLENGQEHFFKYPKQSLFHFDSPIQKVCLTDRLSFDWIVEN